MDEAAGRECQLASLFSFSCSRNEAAEAKKPPAPVPLTDREKERAEREAAVDNLELVYLLSRMIFLPHSLFLAMPLTRAGFFICLHNYCQKRDAHADQTSYSGH